MKKTFAIFALLTLLVLGVLRPARAQATLVHYNALGVMNASANTGSRVYLGDATARAQQVLGPPTRTDSYFSEVDNKTAIRWYYNNCHLTFIDDKLVLYDLNDATLAVGRDFATSFKVGNRIGSRIIRVPGPTRDAPWDTREEDYFYGYKFTASPGTSRNIPFALVSTLELRNDQQTFEGYFEVLFNAQKRIVNIHLAED